MRLLPPARAALGRAARVLARAATAARRVVGAPDYDAYVAHLRVAHPGTVPLTRREFFDARLEVRYTRPGSRCC